MDLGAGLAVGLAGLASGMCIGISGDAGTTIICVIVCLLYGGRTPFRVLLAWTKSRCSPPPSASRFQHAFRLPLLSCACHLLFSLGVRAFERQPRVYVSLILIMIFAEALGLYGLIVAIVLTGQKADGYTCVGQS